MSRNEDNQQREETEPLLVRDVKESDFEVGKRKDRNNFKLYCSHFLSAWGNRMWSFAVGLFLVEISPGSLQLAAIYGLATGISVLLVAPIVGAWVDSAKRLTAARLTIVLQNTIIAVCAGVVYAQVTFTPEQLGLGSWAHYLGYVVIIGLSSAASLASIGNKLCVEKDWVVEICAGDQARLAVTTAILRSIDLATSLLAPIATGFVMNYAGIANGALFIAGWNMLSMIVEYYLIWLVYKSVPALAKSKEPKAPSTDSKSEQCASIEENGAAHTAYTDRERIPNEKETRRLHGPRKVDNKKAKRLSCGLVFSRLTILVRGWKTYASYTVMQSGLALAMLYLTVLSFGNILVGYAKIEGISELALGVGQGLAGLFGFIGATCYPFVQRCIGLPRTGMLALIFQASFLSACVASIWLPGSPYDLFGHSTSSSNCTTNSTGFGNTTTASPCPSGDNSLVSVYVLMAGVIVSRIGLWMADLSISQMFLESVIATERGVVNGVQSSLNKLLDMVKSGLVIALPHPAQFGLLIVISFLSVLSALFTYSIYLCRLPKGAFRKDKDYRDGGGGGEENQKNQERA